MGIAMTGGKQKKGIGPSEIGKMLKTISWYSETEQRHEIGNTKCEKIIYYIPRGSCELEHSKWYKKWHNLLFHILSYWVQLYNWNETGSFLRLIKEK